MFGVQSMIRVGLYKDVNHILDVGSGAGEHAAWFEAQGKSVTTISLIPPADVVGDYMEMPGFDGVDCVWACHVLEHQRNVGAFLDKCRGDLREGGVLAVTVPPAKTALVGGHVTLWTTRLLIYNLVLAGFDCSEARIGFYGYNISVIVRHSEAARQRIAEATWSLTMDHGDIERLAEFFPWPVHQGIDSKCDALRW